MDHHEEIPSYNGDQLKMYTDITEVRESHGVCIDLVNLKQSCQQLHHLFECSTKNPAFKHTVCRWDFVHHTVRLLIHKK